MAKLKIRIYAGANNDPKTTISVPLGMLRFASRFIPRKLRDSLAEKGIAIDMLAELAQSDDIRGTLVEIEEHRKDEKTIISIE